MRIRQSGGERRHRTASSWTRGPSLSGGEECIHCDDFGEKLHGRNVFFDARSADSSPPSLGKIKECARGNSNHRFLGFGFDYHAGRLPKSDWSVVLT